MKVKYNSPVILSLTFAAMAVKLINDSIFPNSTYLLFALLPGMSFLDPLTYIRIFTHVLGHASWAHLLSNFTFILLLGPMLEEKYGSKKLLLMMIVTALATGLLNVILLTRVSWVPAVLLLCLFCYLHLPIFRPGPYL